MIGWKDGNLHPSIFNNYTDSKIGMTSLHLKTETQSRTFHLESKLTLTVRNRFLKPQVITNSKDIKIFSRSVIGWKYGNLPPSIFNNYIDSKIGKTSLQLKTETSAWLVIWIRMFYFNSVCHYLIVLLFVKLFVVIKFLHNKNNRNQGIITHGAPTFVPEDTTSRCANAPVYFIWGPSFIL